MGLRFSFVSGLLSNQNRFPWATLAGACVVSSMALVAHADPFGGLGSVTSTGALGNLSSYIGDGSYYDYFNTDTGVIHGDAGGFATVTVPFTTVPEYPGGPNINVFNFANFDAGGNAVFTFIGNNPAVIAATGNITIAGHLNVASSGGAGGAGGTVTQSNGSSGGNSGGGGGGTGPGLQLGGIAPSYTAGPGGGGGSVSPGQAGTAGTVNQVGVDPFPPYGFQQPGGAGGTAQNTSILQGGGGGGGGGDGIFSGGENDPGNTGGAGGGGLFFVAAGSFTIENGASLNADGGIGAIPNVDSGSSGGGGGGELWFDVGHTFDNEGILGATGGYGGHPGNTAGLDTGGSGSGGALIIDAPDIINNDSINVSDGLGGSTYGGSVELISPDISGTGQITGQVPEPSPLLIAGAAVTGLLSLRRRPAKPTLAT